MSSNVFDLNVFKRLCAANGAQTITTTVQAKEEKKRNQVLVNAPGELIRCAGESRRLLTQRDDHG